MTERVQVARLQIPCRLSTVVVIPSFELSNGVARSVLPRTYSFHDIIYNTQRSALTIAALTTCNKKLLREAMRDQDSSSRIAQNSSLAWKRFWSCTWMVLLGVALSALADRSRVCRTGTRQDSR
jgi:hypothetical protein